EFLENYITINKVYIETFRGELLADSSKLISAKKYLEKKGIQVAGGIAFNKVSHLQHHVRTFCFSDPDDINELKHIVAYTVRFFNEVILDDFFFDNCKDKESVLKKGDKSWAEFRMENGKNIARDIIMKTAKEVNPDIKMVIKFPNYYNVFQYMGFNIKDEAKIFDGIYTSTETRNANYMAQHLHPYQSYAIMR